MAGIYIHIPFCKTRCIYCDFYSTTLSEFKGRYIQTLCRELEIRRDYLQGAPIETIYLGGGTPSQLTQEDFLQIFETIERVYGMKQVREITLEANPYSGVYTDACHPAFQPYQHGDTDFQ